LQFLKERRSLTLAEIRSIITKIQVNDEGRYLTAILHRDPRLKTYTTNPIDGCILKVTKSKQVKETESPDVGYRNDSVEFHTCCGALERHRGHRQRRYRSRNGYVRTLRCGVTPETSRCVMELPFEDGLMELTWEEETGEKEEKPNINEYIAKMWKKYDLWGDSRTSVDTVERGICAKSKRIASLKC
jgi:hypothetical protein